MDANKVLASLCYFSIFFAGFIFPIIVYFVSDNDHVKQHAKKAFISHLIPFLTALGVIICGFALGMFTNGAFLDAIPGIIFIGFILVGIANLIIVIWNIIKGITVLKGV